MTFVYKLTALVQCYEVEVASCELGAGEMRAQLEMLELQLSDIEQEVQAIEQSVNRCWHQLVLYHSGMMFLQEKRIQLQTLLVEVNQTKDSLEKIQEKIVVIRTKIRQLEKHHQKQYEEYRKQQQKLSLNESDDMWLNFIRYKEQTNVY